ncbi:MAG: FAD-binding oxidoreductase [candidate division Zixibacteria bacterium]|jgi:FAD/FMN-containing dehydrogenase|nr:FAD-binding oxidoreductase [candidate division Zixibacteria bacterium]
MSTMKAMLSAIASEFPDDRLTYQKSVPTFHPENADEAARLVRLAGAHRVRLFITGFGNNIDPVGEPFTGMLGVRTDRLNQLIQVAPEDFYAVAGGGYPLRELNLALADNHLYLPHSDLPYVGSVGGAVAVGLTATLHGHLLPIKKYVIKAEIVTPTGEIIRPGSVCFKSVAGYDIVKIFSPSWGVLGLLVSVTFRVMPETARPEYAAMVQNAIDRQSFLAGLDENNNDVDAVYSRKIRAKFDPGGILPVV